jgi:hypothetical protein
MEQLTLPVEGSGLIPSLAMLVLSKLMVAFFSRSEASLISVSKIRIQGCVVGLVLRSCSPLQAAERTRPAKGLCP